MDEHEWVAAQSDRRLMNELIDLARGIRGDPTPRDEALFWCECGRPECGKVINLHHGEYDAARRDDTHFVVARGHAVDGVDVVLATSSRFDLVTVETRYTHQAEQLAPTRRPRRRVAASAAAEVTGAATS